MSDVLVFKQNPDGSITALSAVSTQDGQTVTPAGTVVSATTVPPIQTYSLSINETGPGGVVSNAMFGPNYSGLRVSGQVKLAQRFLLHLMTIQGSILYRPKQGCFFISQLQQRMNNESDVFAAFAAAIGTVRTNMLAEELSTDPTNERFQAAQISQIAVAKGTVTATITVKSLAGTTLNMTIPLSFAMP
jgi:hypothetical protein